jgi:hypothetical protein
LGADPKAKVPRCQGDQPCGAGGRAAARDAGTLAPETALPGTSGPFPALCVPKTLSMSCGQAIFVDQATAASLFSDAVLAEIDWFG